MKKMILFAMMLLGLTAFAQNSPPWVENPNHGLPATFGGGMDCAVLSANGDIGILQTGLTLYAPPDEWTGLTQLSIRDTSGNMTYLTGIFPNLGFSSAVFVDINNDGIQDIYISGAIDDNTYYAATYLGGPGNTYTLHQVLTGLVNSRVTFADLDNNGWQDIIANGRDINDVFRTIIYKNTNGVLSEVTNHGIEGVEGGLGILDYNNDGKKDIVVIASDGPSYVTKLYKSNGNFSFTSVPHNFEPTYESSIFVADFNSDGWDDVAYIGYNNGTYRFNVHLNMQNGTFSNPQSYPGFAGGDIKGGDVDKDGHIDLVVSGARGNQALSTQLYMNDGTGHFVLKKSFQPGVASTSLVLFDLTGDTYLDFLFTGDASTIPWSNAQIRLYTNGTLDTQDFLADELKLWPNPVRDVLNIQAPTEIGSDLRVAMTDMSGRVIPIIMVNGQIDMSGLSSGIYLVTLTSQGQSITKRVVKQ
ncbi:MAG: T9SS type A sorting domain-containing protein [Aequorivita sp.]